METEQKVIFWANAYNAALTGFLSATGRITNELSAGDRNLIRQNCQNLADDALSAIEKQLITEQGPREGFR
jgi:hypothetical protein